MNEGDPIEDFFDTLVDEATERRILKLLTQGLNNEEIVEELLKSK